jgi:hypothetical protein
VLRLQGGHDGGLVLRVNKNKWVEDWSCEDVGGVHLYVGVCALEERAHRLDGGESLFQQEARCSAHHVTVFHLATNGRQKQRTCGLHGNGSQSTKRASGSKSESSVRRGMKAGAAGKNDFGAHLHISGGGDVDGVNEDTLAGGVVEDDVGVGAGDGLEQLKS